MRLNLDSFSSFLLVLKYNRISYLYTARVCIIILACIHIQKNSVCARGPKCPSSSHNYKLSYGGGKNPCWTHTIFERPCAQSGGSPARLIYLFLDLFGLITSRFVVFISLNKLLAVGIITRQPAYIIATRGVKLNLLFILASGGWRDGAAHFLLAALFSICI